MAFLFSLSAMILLSDTSWDTYADLQNLTTAAKKYPVLSLYIPVDVVDPQEKQPPSTSHFNFITKITANINGSIQCLLFKTFFAFIWCENVLKLISISVAQIEAHN